MMETPKPDTLLFVEGFLQMRWFVRVYVCPFVSEAFEGDTVK